MPNLVRTLLVAAVVLLIDRATKIWVVVHLDLANRLHIPVLDPWLNVAMAWNQGINFGLLDFGAAGAGSSSPSPWRSAPASSPGSGAAAGRRRSAPG